MLTRQSNSYYEQYKRTKNVTVEALQGERLLTDRAAYISFLEVQLERVSAACLTTQGFSEHIENLHEKQITVAKAVKLSQSYVEHQAEESEIAIKVVADKLRQLEGAMHELRTNVSAAPRDRARERQAPATAASDEWVRRQTEKMTLLQRR